MRDVSAIADKASRKIQMMEAQRKDINSVNNNNHVPPVTDESDNFFADLFTGLPNDFSHWSAINVAPAMADIDLTSSDKEEEETIDSSDSYN